MPTTEKVYTLAEVEALERRVARNQQLAREAEVTLKTLEKMVSDDKVKAHRARRAYEQQVEDAEMEAAYAATPEARLENLPKSVTVLSQFKKFEKVYSEGEHGTFRITAEVRHDDRCKNGHNTFSITANIDRKNAVGRWVKDSGGCLHDTIAARFPELAPLIKWHLVSTDGPLHYIANTTYHAAQAALPEERRYQSGYTRPETTADMLDYARSFAVWPEATDAELLEPGLRGRLIARLPKLMTDFRAAVEGLGFVY